MMNLRVLACGGRDYLDFYKVDTLLSAHEPSLIIQGEAKGADFLAKAWAYCNNIPTLDFKPDIKKYGSPVAFFMRNQQMLDEGKPDLVIAFPGGTGTADMVRRAKAAGVDVIEVKE